MKGNHNPSLALGPRSDAVFLRLWGPFEFVSYYKIKYYIIFIRQLDYEEESVPEEPDFAVIKF